MVNLEGCHLPLVSNSKISVTSYRIKLPIGYSLNNGTCTVNGSPRTNLMT